MKKIFFKKLIILIFCFNLAFVRPVLALVPPEAPTAPVAPTAPTPPSPPSTSPEAPTAPEPPTPPTPPSPPAEVTSAGFDSQGQITQENQASNESTGANSDNQSSVTNETNLETENNNSGQVTNDINSQVVTGANTASYNTGGGQIVTGNAIQSLQIVTNLNQNTTLYGLNPQAMLNENLSKNILTGPDSNNSSEVTNKLNEITKNNNQGALANKILVNSVSGQNFSSYNTGPGSITTGNAHADLSLLSVLNTNVTGSGGMKTFNIYDLHQGDLVFSYDDFKDGVQFTNAAPTAGYQQANNNVAENVVTGPDSSNSATTQNQTDEKINNNNQAVLRNDIIINALSGENNTVKNTGEGGITTGDASAVGNLINFLNTNLVVEEWMIGVVNIFGELIGDIILPKDEPAPSPDSTTGLAANSATGAGSQNSSDLNNQSTKIFTNYNDAQVLNNIETAAVTGTNTASYNTGPGMVQDGNATVNTQAVNVANTNASGEDETFWVVLVNKMGEWIGKIVGAESGQTIAGNLVVSDPNTEIPEFTNGNLDDENNSVNAGTGPDSDNQTTVNNQESLEVTNNNEAKIENNIKIVAESGKNSGSYNTLGGDVQAGDASAGLSLVNFINTNLVGKKLIVLVVDVLGKWVGDIIPPDQEKQADNSQDNQDQTDDVQQPPSDNNSDDSNNDNNNQDPTGNNLIVGNSDFEATYEEEPEAINTTAAKLYPFSASNFVFGPVEDLSLSNTLLARRGSYKRGIFNYPRGFFVSPAFAQEAGPDGVQTENGGITHDWLYVLLPSFFGIIISKSKSFRTLIASLI